MIDPVPVLDRRELLDYVECVQMDRWYEPPVSFDGLARTFRAAVHHSSPIAVKCNILTSTYIPHPLLSQQAFSRFVQDYLVFGNAYLEKRTNRFGEVIALEPALAKYTRRGLDLDTYWFVQYGMTTQPYQFTKGSIFHLMEPDINQEIDPLLNRTHTLIVASACSAPDAIISRPLLPFTSAEIVLSASHSSTGWPVVSRKEVKFRIVTRWRNRPACILPPTFPVFCGAV